MPTLTDAEQALIVHLEDYPDALYLAGLRAGMELAAKICADPMGAVQGVGGDGEALAIVERTANRCAAAIRDAIPTADSPE